MKGLLILLGIFWFGIAIGSIEGCALIGGPVAEKIASAVEKYCEQPLAYRELYRNGVNAQLTHTGHLVHVHCAGDPVAEQ